MHFKMVWYPLIFYSTYFGKSFITSHFWTKNRTWHKPLVLFFKKSQYLTLKIYIIFVHCSIYGHKRVKGLMYVGSIEESKLPHISLSNKLASKSSSTLHYFSQLCFVRRHSSSRGMDSCTIPTNSLFMTVLGPTL
jgi:hypothetical protein